MSTAARTAAKTGETAAEPKAATNDVVTIGASTVAREANATTPPSRSKEHMMWFGVGIIGAIIWIAIAFWPARVAGRKGHSFIGYFMLSLFFFPLALIMAYMVRDRRSMYVRS